MTATTHGATSPRVATALGPLAPVLTTAGAAVAAAPAQSLLERVRDPQVLSGWPQEEVDLARGAGLLLESRVAREAAARVRADHGRLFASPAACVPASDLARGLTTVGAACHLAAAGDEQAAARALAAADTSRDRLVQWLEQVALRSTTFFYQGVAVAGLGALARLERVVGDGTPARPDGGGPARSEGGPARPDGGGPARPGSGGSVRVGRR